MVNTGTWNSDLVLIFVGMFFLPIFLYFVMGVFLRAIEMSKKTYVINVYEETPKPAHKPYPKPKPAPKPKPKPKAKPKKVKPLKKWDDQMVSDAVSGLAGLGYKRSEARRIVSRMCANKSYEKAEDIVLDVMQNCV
jgi:hypothetical protein